MQTRVPVILTDIAESHKCMIHLFHTYIHTERFPFGQAAIPDYVSDFISAVLVSHSLPLLPSFYYVSCH